MRRPCFRVNARGKQESAQPRQHEAGKNIRLQQELPVARKTGHAIVLWATKDSEKASACDSGKKMLASHNPRMAAGLPRVR